jgi:2-isopropylmalate synthase
VRRIRVFDSSLRDGDQAAGFAFSPEAKLSLARSLAEAGADIIETGFPLSSQADFTACRRAALELADFHGEPGHRALTALMCRAKPRDIRETARVFAGGLEGVLHLSLPVSKAHIEAKLRTTEKAVLALARQAASFAAGLSSRVEMGAEDSSRADPDFLADYCETVLEAGAGVVNIADTMGVLCPGQLAGLVSSLMEKVPRFASGEAVLSVHCHNDMGLACANTLAGIQAGCGQIEVTVCGVGERAGNAALEEVFANLEARPKVYGARTGLIAEKLKPLVRLAAALSGTAASPMKPVGGWNARAHSSGIHQQGISRGAEIYRLPVIEKLDPVPERIVLSRHSGQAGLRLFAKRCCNRDLDEETAARLSVLVKDAPGPLTGITEFLCMLAASGQAQEDIPAPFVCTNFSAAYLDGGAETKSSVRIRAGVLRRANPGGEVSGAGETEAEAVLNAANSFSEHRLELTYSAINGCGNKIRLYAEIAAAGKLYALERIGRQSGRLLFECCLDALNAERLRREQT